MQKTTTMFVGLDVHRDPIAVAYARVALGSELLIRGQTGAKQSDID